MPHRTPKPLEHRQYDAGRLMAEHPPHFRHPNKQAVYDLACPAGFEAQGDVIFSRWGEFPLPDLFVKESPAAIDARPDIYDYAPTAQSASRVEWHVNFADSHLFVAYPTGLFAQDELQVAEHPALASLREALESGDGTPATIEHALPTPVLVRGVERRVRIALNPDAAAGRPHGLYGNHFARAELDAVRKAVTVLDPPTISNIICMAAPSGGSGAYTMAEIEDVLLTAYTGFRAAAAESHDAAGPDAQTVVHTGYWGCGAFGGNRTLMAMLQVLAARMAGLHALVFHTVDEAGLRTFAAAMARLDPLLIGDMETTELMERIAALKLEWGVSDGN